MRNFAHFCFSYLCIHVNVELWRSNKTWNWFVTSPWIKKVENWLKNFLLKMVFLLNALTISSKRVFSTLWNIILFRCVYEFVKSRIFTGVVGFIIAIYVSDYIRKFLYRQWAALKKRAFQNSKAIENEFDPKYLESIVLEYDQLENTTENDELNKTLLKFKERTQIKCKNDLFDYIFTASTHSVLLSFITMFSIEIVQSNYGYGVMTSILYCSTIPFILCFGSSYRLVIFINKIIFWINKLY